jgi:ABC-type transporter Mla subunit MlaD
MNDRQIGYVSLGFLSLFIVVCLGLIIRALFLPFETRHILFENIGTLRLEDPVQINGVDVATIAAIDWRQQHALVTITAQKPLNIHADYTISTVDVGLMGERVIALHCGSETKPLIPPSDTLRGIFVLGPSEALGMIAQLDSIVRSFSAITQRLRYGAGEQKPLVQRYEQLIFMADSMSLAIQSIAQRIDTNFTSQLNQLTTALSDVNTVTKEASARVPELLATLETFVTRTTTVVDSGEALLGRLSPALTTMTNSEHSAKLDAMTVRLRTTLSELKALLQELSDTGLKLKIIPF